MEAVVGAVSKLMGPEGYNGRATGVGGGAVEKVDVPHSEAASVLIKPSINACSSLLTKTEHSLWRTIPEASSSFHEKDSLKHVNFGITLMSGQGDNQLQKKSGKLSRLSNEPIKRSRLSQMEPSESVSVEDVKRASIEPGISDETEKGHGSKQKSLSKRWDKRNGKSVKSRGDSFCLKNGLVSFNSAAGGNSFLGAYGSKLDLVDVTKHVSELSLNELLDGSYKCPIYAKDKGKKATYSNENLLHSVRKAWSILQLQKPVLPQNSGEIDNNCRQITSAGLLCSGSYSANECDGDKGDNLTAELSTCTKESGENLNTPEFMVALPLNQPKEVLEHLSLPPSKDLDSLLLDAAKPTVSSRNGSDLRFGKPGACRTGLPPFPWSHSSSAHFKSGFDAAKLSTARNTCQGRWVKVENNLTPPKESACFLVNLDSLTFDNNLVPSLGLESGPPENKKASSESFRSPPSDQVLTSSAVCSTSHGQADEHSPRLLAAAQVLYEMSVSSMIQNSDGMPKWLKKPSEKVTKISKINANDRKSGFRFGVPRPTTGADFSPRADAVLPPKKIKLTHEVKSVKFSESSTAWTKPVSWSAPRSIRSSPSKLSKESTVEVTNKNSSVVNKSCMMPPPSRLVDNPCSSRQKLKKVGAMELNLPGSKLNH